MRGHKCKSYLWFYHSFVLWSVDRIMKNLRNFARQHASSGDKPPVFISWGRRINSQTGVFVPPKNCNPNFNPQSGTSYGPPGYRHYCARLRV